MKRAAFLIVVACVFVLMAGAVLTRGLLTGSAGPEAMSPGRAMPVAVTAAEPREFAEVVEALGTANANESVVVTATVSDRISRIAFESGDQMRAGSILVELADAEAAADLTEARAALREANRELERTRELAERGIASRARLDELTSSTERARARVTALEARVAERIIRAPFDGVVGLRNVSLGQLVRPGDVVAQLDDVSIIKLDFTLPERFLSVIEAGMEVHARTAAFSSEVFAGRIEHISSRVDPVVRTVTVRASIDNADNRLRPGMLMTVQLRRDVRERLAAPETAITRTGDRVTLFVVQEADGRASVAQRTVQLGQRQAGYFEILDGLEPGDLVVVHGVHRLRDGMPVRIQNGPEAAGPRVAAAARSVAS
ncbi:efflux RND transporter periplasmic adaptor subunit [Alkalicaulis satelles]|uniref:Efflux RND transporter periplasmic adaptor subunit n=1 Tax=Alkalicaulis satelles TaxID=2609175 RepID=A0A5M6ZJK5_9PROT|nr:efflux RND transporter periplasmic adaptor subunit [Alkalicaulis satelles]KAA5804983.1 efflux RND transporter periplasmic adaptor subunit [Alkalicaulis satelles]